MLKILSYRFGQLFKETASLKTSSALTVFQVVLGACYLALLSQLYIPFEPVRMTLQTFAIFTMGLYMGKNKAAYSVLAYLAAGTVALPVFPGLQSNPLWFLLPTAGFYFSFPVAAYVIGAVLELKKQRGLLWMALSVLAGQGVIYICGISWLTFWFGFEKALAVGFYPFIGMAAIKLAAALTVKKSTDELYVLSHNWFSKS